MIGFDWFLFICLLFMSFTPLTLSF